MHYDSLSLSVWNDTNLKTLTQDWGEIISGGSVPTICNMFTKKMLCIATHKVAQIDETIKVTINNVVYWVKLKEAPTSMVNGGTVKYTTTDANPDVSTERTTSWNDVSSQQNIYAQEIEDPQENCQLIQEKLSDDPQEIVFGNKANSHDAGDKWNWRDKSEDLSEESIVEPTQG